MSWTWHIRTNNVNEVWDQIMQRTSSATFFQTRAWAELFSKTFPSWGVEPIAIEFSDGNMMVLPMLKHKLSGYRECMVPHVYGGPVFLQSPGKDHLREFHKIPLWFTDLTLIENPFEPILKEQEGIVRWQLYTNAVDLTPGFDLLWQRFRKNHRQNFKSAVKQGLTMSLANSREDIIAYYDMYQLSLRRWGKNAIGFWPRSFFLNMLNMPEFGKDIKMYIARKDDEVTGGIIMVYHGAQAIYWHGVSHSSYLSAHPSPFLLISAINNACNEGYRWFDFMGPNKRQNAVQHFKDGFAIQKLPYNVYYSNNSTKGRIFKRYRFFKEKYLRRCPM